MQSITNDRNPVRLGDFDRECPVFIEGPVLRAFTKNGAEVIASFDSHQSDRYLTWAGIPAQADDALVRKLYRTWRLGLRTLS